MKKILLFLLVFPVVQLFGQDTLSVYFETGKSKITDNHIRFLNSVPAKYDLSDLDSVHYIGAADPVGNVQSNVKLSEKRAKNTANYCKSLFSETVTSTIIALGTIPNQEYAQSRKVDIVFFFKSEKEEETKMTNIDSTENYCYYIDYKLLHRSHIRTITKRQEEYVLIEALLPDLKKKKEHYYGTMNSDGKFEIHQVKWASKKMGKDWWKSYPTTATIPKKDFETYKLFKIEEAPCTACNEDFSEQTEVMNEEKYMHLDTFLMRKIQFKFPFLRKNRVNIRAPKEYVDIEDNYFVGCYFSNTLNWKTKKGKRKQDYYYSYLPVLGGHVFNIARLMSDCKHAPELSQCDKSVYSGASFAIYKSFLFNVEIGSRYFASKITAYAGLGASKEWEYSRIAAQFALEYNLRFHGSLNYQFHFFSFPFYKTKDFFGWASPSDYPLFSRYARLYVGTDLRSGINNEKKAYLEQGLFLGFAYVDYDTFLSRIYIQGGVGMDYLKNLSSMPYPTIQAGIIMRFAS
ncbi:MAG: hypothetical protein FWH36_04705 [Lentimicrobiaceae bacterium]|nr:hypothetical protein [Lentimicrobiaceae bacterium]